MTEIMSISATVRCGGQRHSWLRRLLRILGRTPRHDRAARIDTETWSHYMLRDVGLGRGGGSADPRSLPLDWPLR